MAATASVLRADSKIHNDSVAFASGLTPETYNIFKMGEALAHDHAYSLHSDPKSNIDVYLAEIDKLIPHDVIKLKTNHSALVAYVLLPTLLLKEAENKIDIKIIFKGTSDLAGMGRNLLERGGAGHESFHVNKRTLIKQINDIMKQYRLNLGKTLDLKKIKFSMTIAGHSLGAADAQRMLLAIKEAIAQNWGCTDGDVTIEGVSPAERDQFEHIDKIRLYTFNATGCSETDHEQLLLISGFLNAVKEKRKNLKLDTELNIFYADGDGVQQTGSKHIFYTASPQQALIRFVKAKNIYTGQNTQIAGDLYNTMLTWVGKTKFLQNPKILMAMSGLGLYYIGVSSVYAGLTGISGTLINYYDQYQMANSGYSLYALYQATKATHTAFYFKDSFADFRSRPLKHNFIPSTNQSPKEQSDIQGELAMRSPTANAAHTAVAHGYNYICRSRKSPVSSISSPLSANAAAITANSAEVHPNASASASATTSTATASPPMTIQFTNLNTNSMKQHQNELANAEAQAAADKKAAERCAALEKAKRAYL